MGEIEFKGELHALPADAALVLKADRPLNAQQVDQIVRYCKAALGTERRVLVVDRSMTVHALKDEKPTRTFSGKNACGASVYDVCTKQKLGQVMSVDIDSGEVKRYHQPMRLVGDEVATYTERYRSIHPIYGGNPVAVLFHCYDRLA